MSDEPDPIVSCKFCGSTDVYWMTVLGRREAEFLAANGRPLALKLAKGALFNVTGGRHVCRGGSSSSDFEVIKL